MKDVVSDNSSVFTSDIHEGLQKELEIEVCHIEQGKPWQNLIEARFKVELRLADAQLERAITLEELQEQHATFLELFNTTPHWANRDGEDGSRTPVEAIRWVSGPDVEQETLHRALQHLQMGRIITPRCYVSVQRSYLYCHSSRAVNVRWSVPP